MVGFQFSDMMWETRRHLRDLTSVIGQPIIPDPGSSLAEQPSASAASGSRGVMSSIGDERCRDSRLASSHKICILDARFCLPQLVSADHHILRSSEARAIVSGLEDLLYTALGNLLDQKSRGRPDQALPCVEYARASGSHNDIELELRLISSLITSARQISINTQSRDQTGRQLGAILQQQRKRKRVIINEGLLMLSSVKRHRMTGPESSSWAHFEVAGEEFLGTVTFFPANPLSSFMVIASVHQEELRGRTYSETPRLCVNRVLPCDAPVFKTVQGGRVEELQALISEGKASLRDRDVNGLSLLHVSAPSEVVTVWRRSLANGQVAIVCSLSTDSVPLPCRWGCRCERNCRQE